MAVYLVDYENVNATLLTDEEMLKSGDEVVIFYSRQASSISIDTLGKLQGKDIEVSFIKTTVGTSNALDFQLVSYLGYLICKDRKREFHIVSHDNGFQCVCDFWKDKNVQVDLIPQIGSEVSTDEREEYRVLLEPMIKDEKQLTDTIKAVQKAKTKTEINIWLTKHYEGEKVRAIHKALKSLIKELPGS